MAKTFNPNRVGGGTVSIVRAADGTYSLKETGFDQISSLNMIDLGAVATTTTAAKTETAAEKTGTTTADQTKAAFLLPKQDRDDNKIDTTGQTLKNQATDVSKLLSDSATQTMIANQEAQEQAAGISGVNPFRNIDTGVGEFEGIKDPTEPVFGRSMPSKEQFQRQTSLPETPQDKLKLSDAEKEKRKPKFLSNILDTLKGPMLKRDETRFTSPSERAALGFPGDKTTTTFGTGTATSTQAEQEAAALGVSADPSKTTVPFGTSVDNIQGFTDKKDFISVPAKKTFAESVSTALNSVGGVVAKAAQLSPTLNLIKAVAGETNSQVHARGYFNIAGTATQPQRIAGNPAENVFAGANANVKDLDRVAQKRIDMITKNLAAGKYKDPDKKRQQLKDFKDQQREYRRDRVTKTAKRKGLDTSNPNEMRQTDGGASASGGRSKIVCTMMNESYGFGSFRNKIWLRHSKNLAPEYQRGYHRLFLPLVKKAKTNKILKKILEHIAVHRTIDIRQQEKNKIHLIGRVYRTILEPICYWAGKK